VIEKRHEMKNEGAIWTVMRREREGGKERMGRSGKGGFQVLCDGCSFVMFSPV
jgi:hypothetical protein